MDLLVNDQTFISYKGYYVDAGHSVVLTKHLFLLKPLTRDADIVLGSTVKT